MGNSFKNPQQREHWNDYNKRYANKHYKSFCLKLNKETDKDIIDFLSANGKSPTAVVRALVREKTGTGE